MSIRQKTVLTVSVTLLVLIVVLYFLLSAIVMRGFGTVENTEAIQNVQRVEDAFRSRIAAIDGSIFTWSQWTDCHDYLKAPSPAFETANLSSTIYTGMNLNFAFFIDKNLKVVYEGGYDLAGNKSLPIPESLRKWVSQGSVLFTNTDPMMTTKGFALLPEGPVLLVAAPVTNTAGDAPYSGFVVFGRYFDKGEQESLSSVTHLKLDFSIDGPPITGIQIEPVDSGTINGRISLTDLEEKPVLNLTVHMPRDVHQQGMKSLRLMIGSIVVIGVLFGLIILLLIEKIVLRRISQLSREVHDISEQMDFNRRVAEEGSDEITRLSRQINGLVAAVSEIIHALEQEK